VKLRQVAEVASHAATNALLVVESPEPLDPEPLARYWEWSRRRLHAWMTLLSKDTLEPASFRPLLGEIFVGEMLACVWSAVLESRGRRQHDATAAAVGRKTFEEHQKLRHLAMSFMVRQADAHVREVADADQLRRRSERWTDVLLGGSPGEFDLERFAHDLRRARDFRADSGTAADLGVRSVRRSLLSASLRTAFPAELVGLPAHDELHREVVSAVLSLIPADGTEFAGGLHSFRHAAAARETGLRFTRLVQRRK
jgi:hypothetical protein